MGESNSNYGNVNFSEEIVEESLREVWNALCEFPYLEASFSWNMIAYFERTTHESWDNLRDCSPQEKCFLTRLGISSVYKSEVTTNCVDLHVIRNIGTEQYCTSIALILPLIHSFCTLSPLFLLYSDWLSIFFLYAISRSLPL